MLKRYAIFDMDGTILDSMPVWRSLGKNFLLANNVTPPEDLRKIIAPLTLPATAEYFQTLGIKGGVEEIVEALNGYMRAQYETTIAPRACVEDYIKALHNRGVRCCVATATDERLAKICLERLNLLHYFEFIVSCETIGIGKTQPDVYFLAAQRLGAEPHEIAVLEDAPYAAETAKQAGFYVIGIHDPSAERHQARLKETIDEYITDFAEAAKAVEKQ